MLVKPVRTPGTARPRRPRRPTLIVAALSAAAIVGLTPTPALPADLPDIGGPLVRFRTNQGTFEVRLAEAQTPETVRNFMGYVERKFFNGTIFHRVEDELVQGGGYTFKGEETEPDAPVRHEGAKCLSNVRGTISMAHGNDPHDGDSQFFINLEDNPGLDFESATTLGYGYCAFGVVVAGMDVLDSMLAIETEVDPMMGDHVPTQRIIIYSARRVAE